MSKVFSLSELSAKIARTNTQQVDAMTAKYLEEVIKHITERGDKIEDYTLALVSNPMEFKDSGLRVTMQYRVCRVDELQNLPIYSEGGNPMTQPNQSGLKGLLDDLVDEAIEFGHADYTGPLRTDSERAKDYENITTMVDRIAANYTPNTEVEQRERVARINEGQLFREAMIEHSTPAIYWGDRLDELTKLEAEL